MTEARREGRVLEAVVTLVDSLLDDFDVVELLTDLTEQCAELLNVASAGLLLADPRHHLHLMAATSGKTHDLELFQLQTDEGPCLDCFTSGEAVSVSDLHSEAERWPRFVAAATAAGFAAVHAIPMRAAGTVIGTLGLFGVSTGDLSPSDQTVGQTLAHIATVAILQEHGPSPEAVQPRLRNALTGRVVVEQAKGFLHQRVNVSVDEAFELMRSYAHTHNRHLTEVARTLIFDRDARSGILADIARSEVQAR